MTNSQSATSAPARATCGGLRYRCGWVMVVAVILALAAGHRPLLRVLAVVLIVEAPAVEAPWLVLFDGDRMSDYVAQHRKAAAQTRVLLIERAPQRTQALGLRPSWVEERRSSLLARGLPASEVDVLAGPARDDWDRARILRTWLEQHPEAHASVLCDRFRSRRLRIILDRVLGSEAGRAHIVALPDRAYDETNWWRNKDGLLGLSEGLTRLTYVALAPEGDRPGPAWDADAYERALP